jgi:hypothetical protein
MKKLSNGECVMLTEGSSSKTSIYIFNSLLNQVFIDEASKMIVSEPIHLFVKSNNAELYYEMILNNKVVQEYIGSSSCDKIYWSILSTGGMRRLRDEHGVDKENNFYSKIRQIHDEQKSAYIKEVILDDVRTIEGSDEGVYAWKSLQYTISHQHAVIDLGGETIQVSTGMDSIHTSFNGRDRTQKDMGAHEIEVCLNKELSSKTCSNEISYDGESCRVNIQNHIDVNFIDIPRVDSSYKLYGISNFYYFFNDLCNIYSPYIAKLADISEEIKVICAAKQTNNIVLRAVDYKDIADEICEYWNPEWKGKEAVFAKELCFSGNYIYQLLRSMGMLDDDLVYPDNSDWAPGAVASMYYSSDDSLMQ